MDIDEKYPANRIRLDIFKILLDDLKPKTILDVGCGSGMPMIELLEMGFDVEGFEYQIICGGRRTFQKLSPKLFIEIHPSKMAEYGDSVEKILKELSNFNYHLKYLIWEPKIPIYLTMSRLKNIQYAIHSYIPVKEFLKSTKLR